jgi:acyl carrier protein
MNEPVLAGLSWEEFVQPIADIARIDASDISPSTRLVADLDLDSLALTEVVVLLIVERGMESLSIGLEDRDWTELTVGELHREYVSEPQAELRRQRFRFSRT